MNKHKFFKTYSSFFQFLENLKTELIIISPYIKIGALEKLLMNIPKNIRVIVVCRWKISDLVLGVSDLQIYRYTKDKKYNLFVNKDIHLKVLMKDKKEIIIGSANITDAGLGFANKSNIEAIAIDDVNDEDVSNIMKIIKKSILVDEDLFNRFVMEVSKYKEMKKNIEKYIKNVNKFNSRLLENRSINILVSDFPFCTSPKDFIQNYKLGLFESPEMLHDTKLFELSKNEKVDKLYDILRKSFLEGDAFLWQKNIIKDQILFGKYSELLHDSIVDNPKPYRKRVKELVANMFNWTSEFSNDYGIKKYNHTSALKKI